jgi:hypothetical protein
MLSASGSPITFSFAETTNPAPSFSTVASWSNSSVSRTLRSPRASRSIM